MARVMAALVLGTISLIVVFLSGLSSGDVRLSTIFFRTIVAFCVSSAISYFLLMAFDLYEEHIAKTLEQVKKEVADEEKNEENSGGEQSTGGNDEEQPPEGFQPMNLGN